MECLHFVRRFFLMDQGDFFVQFLDLTEHELLLPVKKVSKGRIQSLLGLAIQLSSSNQTIERDRQRNTEDVSFDSETKPKRALFHSDLVCKFEHDHFIDRLDAIHKKSGGIVNSNATSSTFPRTPSRHAYGMVGGPNGEGGGLRGIEALTLDCKVDFPLSLILSREVMTSYQLLFRHLFFSKYVERRLFGTWLDHQMLKGLNLRAYMGKTYLLRQRMLHFMQNFVYYMMFEVIEPHWIDLIKQLNNADTVDGLMQVHKSFQADILQECLLTNTELLSVLAKLMTTCLNFSDQMRLFAAKTRIDEEFAEAATEYRLARWNATGKKSSKAGRTLLTKIQQERKASLDIRAARVKKELKSSTYQKMISRIGEDFDESVARFMYQLSKDSKLQAHAHLVNLSTRLDYNEFISTSNQSL